MVASLVSPLVHCFFIKGPQVMMNISSLATRHNPHMPLSDGGSFLEASDRARPLKDMQSRYGDLDRQASVGHLAIGVPSGVVGPPIARIHKRRLYE
jgi:hypothetical protein